MASNKLVKILRGYKIHKHLITKDILRIDLSNYLDKAADIYLYKYFGQQVGDQKVDNGSVGAIF
jgi:hypothetical protein